MKKILLAFVITLLVIPFVAPAKTRAEEAAADAYCKVEGGELHSVPLGTGTVTQTFIPSYNRIVKLSTSISIPSSHKISVSITNTTGDKLMTGEFVFGPLDQTIAFDPATVIPGETYTINYTGDNYTRVNGPDDPNCYKSGEMLFNGAAHATIKDLDFTVYGYNASAPAGGSTETPATDSSSTTTTTTTSTPSTSSTASGTANPTAGQTGVTRISSGAVPASTTSSSINPPTQLAVAQTTGKTARLSWVKSSSTDIEGYKIFRKEASGDYKEIATAKSSIETFEDTVVSLNVEYTYMIRAYKGSDESANSNEAIITLTSTSNTSSASRTDQWYKNPWLWVSCGLIVLIIAFGIFWIIKHKKISLKIENKQN